MLWGLILKFCIVINIYEKVANDKICEGRYTMKLFEMVQSLCSNDNDNSMLPKQTKKKPSKQRKLFLHLRK